MPSNRKNIIITADDYGCCEFIDRGIIKGIKKGVISCVSAFVNFEPRKAGERGGTYKGSIAAIRDLLNLFPDFPVGIHLSINAGTPILEEKNVAALLRSNKIDGKHYFKSFRKFDPDLYFHRKVIKQIKQEIKAQIDFFKSEIDSKNLNHLTSHYGILFHFENILKEMLTIKDFKELPIRNPILAFQVPIDRREEGRKELKKMQKFFRSKSKMRIEGIGNVIRWSDSLEKFAQISLQGKSVKKRIALLQKNKTRFPEFTLDYLYQRQGDFVNMGIPISKLSNASPDYFLSPSIYSPIYEFIAHVGSGKLPATGPVGVNKSYFRSRTLELKRLIDSEAILKTNSVNLIDFAHVNEEGMV